MFFELAGKINDFGIRINHSRISKFIAFNLIILQLKLIELSVKSIFKKYRLKISIK